MDITTWIKTGTLALLLSIQACTPEEWAMAAGQPGTPVTPDCGATLSASGNYVLDANLTNCPNPAATNVWQHNTFVTESQLCIQ